MTDHSIHEKFMLRCLELASKGLGRTRSNPLAGSVIVHNGIIIGEGYHHEFGGQHAEVNAINSVNDKSKLINSTLYVNLEPCNHKGKTPPCSLLIKNVNIPEVITGSIDPNPLVAGKGILFLRENGVEVVTHVLEKECKFLNRRFYTFHEKKRPYIILKWAKTSDGFLDTRERGDDSKPPLKITGKLSDILVHKWRSEEMAVFAGTHTVNMDNPSLTVRYWSGINPLRISLERNTSLNRNLKIFSDGVKTLIYTNNKKSLEGHVEYTSLPQNKGFPENMLNDLYERNILSQIVEGGADILNCFIKQNLWDEARIFAGNISAGKGVPAPGFHYHGQKYSIGPDELFVATRLEL